MKTHRILIALLAAAGAAPAAAGLVQDYLDGIRRVCVYEKIGRFANEREAIRIGAGEPCPLTQPRQRAARPPAVPAMATLVATRNASDGRTCVYRYNGRDYPRRIDAGQSCPLTPHF